MEDSLSRRLDEHSISAHGQVKSNLSNVLGFVEASSVRQERQRQSCRDATCVIQKGPWQFTRSATLPNGCVRVAPIGAGPACRVPEYLDGISPNPLPLSGRPDHESQEQATPGAMIASLHSTHEAHGACSHYMLHLPAVLAHGMRVLLSSWRHACTCNKYLTVVLTYREGVCLAGQRAQEQEPKARIQAARVLAAGTVQVRWPARAMHSPCAPRLGPLLNLTAVPTYTSYRD